MHQSFWWDVDIKNLLFYGYNISSILTLSATCLGLLLLGILMEWMGLVQAKLRHKELVLKQQQLRTICPSESDTLLASNQEPGTSRQSPAPLIPTVKDKIFHFCSDLAMWLSQQCIAYLLMLTVMTYNGYFVIVIIAGYAIGYFIFGQAAIKIKLKNCQVKRDTFCMPDCSEPDRTALIRPELTIESERDQEPPICINVASGSIICEAIERTNS